MTIRPATGADIAAVHAIAAANPTAPQWTVAQFRGILRPERGLAVTRGLLVSLDGQTVTGFAVVSALGSVYPVEAELESIAVAPVLHGKGIGLALLAGVLSWCKDALVSSVRLEVRASNRHAIALYKRVGFQTEGIRPGYYQRPAEDAVCMTWMTSVADSLPEAE